MATSVDQGATGDSYIDGLLFGTRWSGSITFSFPQLTTDYQAGNPEADFGSGFAPVTLQQREATRAILTGLTAGGASNVMTATSLDSFILSSVSEAGGNGSGLNGAGDIRLGQSNDADPTAYAYFPNDNANGNGGDVWFGTAEDYTDPVMGNYAYHTHIHELGHALGLKHSHELGGVANLAVPADRDAIEWTVMSYRSYVGGPSGGSYTFGTWDAPTTFMVYDIQALQTMYGAFYGANNGATTYTWSATTGETFINGVSQGTPGANKIFMTVWDGGGVDTYDMSNYSGGVSISLIPGSSSITSEAQRADLGAGNQAQGNVYNSLLFGGNLASIIENAIGGAGADTIFGNQVANVLTGNGGADRLFGAFGDDTLNGGGGLDTMDGGLGNDTFFVDLAGDIIVEGLGGGTADRARASVSFTLATDDDIEILQTTSASLTTAINLTGNALAQSIYGNNGVNTLNGGIDALADTLVGYAGDDTYLINSASDIIVESAGGGTADRARASVSFTLAADDNIEILQTNNANLATAINLTGNALAQSVYGNIGSNVLNGGAGSDTLTGYAGSDFFLFNTTLNTATNRDVITDFSVAADTIRLENAIFTLLASTGALAGALFKDVIAGAQDANDVIVYNRNSGNIYYDNNGLTAGGTFLFAEVDNGTLLTAADFVVV